MGEIRILIVEDNISTRMLLSEFLVKQEGISVIGEASNGIEALEILAKEAVDIILLDIIMPKMDGFQVLEELRKTKKKPIPKSIVLSALTRDDFIKRAVDLGVSYYMVKPINCKTLLAQIHKVLGLPLTPSSLGILDERLSKLLMKMGVPVHVLGYRYLREAIKMVIAHPDLLNHITKELYPKVGIFYNSTAANVERNIRLAIQVAWNRGEKDLGNIFGYKAISMEDKPTNGEFIAKIVAIMTK